MSEILHKKITEINDIHENKHETYKYTEHKFVPRGHASQCMVSVYEIPPGKSAYPYHYHKMNEEVFYVISGTGVLKSPDGDKLINAGELLFFPACDKGAHKLINTSETEVLKYIDFSTTNDIDVCFYPDSGKIGVWGKDIDHVYRTRDTVDYYEGE